MRKLTEMLNPPIEQIENYVMQEDAENANRIYSQLIQKGASQTQGKIFLDSFDALRTLGILETMKSPDYLNRKTGLKDSPITPASEGVAHIVLETNPEYAEMSIDEIAKKFELSGVTIGTKKIAPHHHGIYMLHQKTGEVVRIDLYNKPNIHIPVPNKYSGGFMPYGGGGYGMPGGR